MRMEAKEGHRPQEMAPASVPNPGSTPSCCSLCASVSSECRAENTKSPAGSNRLAIPALPGVWHQDVPLHHSFGVAELPHEAGPGSQAAGSLCGASASRGRLFLAMRGCSLHGAAVSILCTAGTPLSSHAPGQGGISQNKKQLAWTQVLPVLSLVTVTWPHCPQCSWFSPCPVRSCITPFPLCLRAFLLSPGFIALPRILAVRNAVASCFWTVSFCHSQSDDGQIALLCYAGFWG